MLEVILETLPVLFTWPTIIYPVLGTLLGLFFGGMPGLGTTTALALSIPLTYGFEPYQAIIFLGSIMGATAFGGSIPAILINTPGMGPNAASCFDGYPMAKQGKAAIALGASATASLMGALFGIIVCFAILPFARRIILAFSYPEFFMLAILGLSIIAVVSEAEGLVKGLIAGGFGLLISFIGFDPIAGELRYIHGVEYLWDGIKIIPAVVGLFAIGESIHLLSHSTSIVELNVEEKEKIKRRSIQDVIKGIKVVFQHKFLLVRSSIIGTIVGMIPGVGGGVANFLSYWMATVTEKNPETFGKGDVRGLIASEASNDAKDGGALLPTLVFGIPGSAGTAILLGGLMLHGLSPGRRMLTDDFNILILLLFALLLGNILTSVFGLLMSGYFVNLTLLPIIYISPLVFVIALIGVFTINRQFGDVLVAVLFGIIGFEFKKWGFPRIAVILALMLGSLAEVNYHLTVRIFSWQGFFFRPISFVLFLLTVMTLAFPIIRRMLHLNSLRKNAE